VHIVSIFQLTEIYIYKKYTSLYWNLFTGEELVCWLHLSIIISWHCDILLDAILTLATCSMSCVYSWKVLPVSLECHHFYGTFYYQLLLLPQDLHHHSILDNSVSWNDKRQEVKKRIFCWRPSWVMPTDLGMEIGKWIFCSKWHCMSYSDLNIQSVFEVHRHGTKFTSQFFKLVSMDI
jgi:hypothetical protein